MKQTLQLGFLSAINLLITFCFQWYVITVLGPNNETDALFAGMAIPQFILAIISGSLMHVLVPILSGEPHGKFYQDVWTFVYIIAAVFSVSAALLAISTTLWLPIFLPGFDALNLELTDELTKIQLVVMIFTAINGVQWAAYHAKQKFIWVEMSAVITGGISIFVLIWAIPRYGVIAAAYINVLRAVLQTVLLTPILGKPKKLNLHTEVVMQSWISLKPLLMGTTYYKTDPIIDRTLLSTSTSGSISLYYFAQQIYNACNQILNKAVAAPLVPILSNLSKADRKEELKQIYRNKVTQVFITLSAALFLGAVAWEILFDLMSIKFGNMTQQKLDQLFWILVWLTGMFVGGGLGQICSSTFYAVGDTHTPTKMSVITYSIYIPCKVICFCIWGVMGLALITSCYYITNLLLMIFLFEKKIR